VGGRSIIDGYKGAAEPYSEEGIATRVVQGASHAKFLASFIVPRLTIQEPERELSEAAYQRAKPTVKDRFEKGAHIFRGHIIPTGMEDDDVGFEVSEDASDVTAEPGAGMGARPTDTNGHPRHILDSLLKLGNPVTYRGAEIDEVAAVAQYQKSELRGRCHYLLWPPQLSLRGYHARPSADGVWMPSSACRPAFNPASTSEGRREAGSG